MQEIIKIIIGIAVLALGIPIGRLLAKIASDELKSGQKWFKILIGLSMTGAIISLVLMKDYLLFILLFIAIVTSQSLIIRKKRKKK